MRRCGSHAAWLLLGALALPGAACRPCAAVEEAQARWWADQLTWHGVGRLPDGSDRTHLVASLPPIADLGARLVAEGVLQTPRLQRNGQTDAHPAHDVRVRLQWAQAAFANDASGQLLLRGQLVLSGDDAWVRVREARADRTVPLEASVAVWVPVRLDEDGVLVASLAAMWIDTLDWGALAPDNPAALGWIQEAVAVTTKAALRAERGDLPLVWLRSTTSGRDALALRIIAATARHDGGLQISMTSPLRPRGEADAPTTMDTQGGVWLQQGLLLAALQDAQLDGAVPRTYADEDGGLLAWMGIDQVRFLDERWELGATAWCVRSGTCGEAEFRAVGGWAADRSPPVQVGWRGDGVLEARLDPERARAVAEAAADEIVRWRVPVRLQVLGGGGLRFRALGTRDEESGVTMTGVWEPIDGPARAPARPE